MTLGPAYRIETPRLVIRCLAPGDAPLLQVAIHESLAALRPWLPWTQAEPEELDAKAERLRQLRARFDLGEDFAYGVFDLTEQRCIGCTGLHTRQGPNVREIGYWIRTSETRRGYATEVCHALIQVAFRVDRVPRVEIRCEPSNVASVAVARKAGLSFEGTLRANTVRPDGSLRDTLVFGAIASEADALPGQDIAVRAWSALGDRLL